MSRRYATIARGFPTRRDTLGYETSRPNLPRRGYVCDAIEEIFACPNPHPIPIPIPDYPIHPG